MSLRQLCGVAVLDRTPTDEEAESLAADLINKERPGAAEDPSLAISWFCSQEIPPQGVFDLPLFERDQLSSHLRDGLEATYFVVMAERVTPTKEKNF